MTNDILPITDAMIEAGCVEAGEWEPEAHSTPECVSAIYRAMSALSTPQPGEDEVEVLPCDVKLPPATTIGVGCKLSTLHEALRARGMAAAIRKPVGDEG